MERLKERKTSYGVVDGKLIAQRLCSPTESEDELLIYELNDEPVIRLETKQVFFTSPDFDPKQHC